MDRRLSFKNSNERLVGIEVVQAFLIYTRAGVAFQDSQIVLFEQLIHFQYRGAFRHSDPSIGQVRRDHFDCALVTYSQENTGGQQYLGLPLLGIKDLVCLEHR
jgi:hypothetical protein